MATSFENEIDEEDWRLLAAEILDESQEEIEVSAVASLAKELTGLKKLRVDPMEGAEDRALKALQAEFKKPQSKKSIFAYFTIPRLQWAAAFGLLLFVSTKYFALKQDYAELQGQQNLLSAQLKKADSQTLRSWVHMLTGNAEETLFTTEDPAKLNKALDQMEAKMLKAKKGS